MHDAHPHPHPHTHTHTHTLLRSQITRTLVPEWIGAEMDALTTGAAAAEVGTTHPLRVLRVHTYWDALSAHTYTLNHVAHTRTHAQAGTHTHPYTHCSHRLARCTSYPLL